MGPSGFESVYRSVKRGEIAPVYYLTGDADVLKDDLVAEIVDATVEVASRDFNLDVRAAGDLDSAGLHALVETLPVLAERRVVVIKGLEQWRKNARTWEALRGYLARPATTTVLILTHGGAEQKTFLLNKNAITLGKARGCDIILDSDDVHCVICRSSGFYEVRDCNSRTGVQVNGDAVTEAVLHDGDALQVGNFTFQVVLPDKKSAGGGVDRVIGVPGVGDPVTVPVGAVAVPVSYGRAGHVEVVASGGGTPGGAEELHRPAGAGVVDGAGGPAARQP